MMIPFISLQESTSVAIGGAVNPMQLVLILSIFVVFYFFSIRPQQKRYKDQKSFLETIKPGARVVTIGGIHGEVVQVDPDTITLEVDPRGGSRMVLEKGAISVEASKKCQPQP